MNPFIFREYDIRGEVDKDLTQETITLIGKGIGTYIARRGGKRVSLARDCRISSKDISMMIGEELSNSGLTVYDIGECPTPVSYFSLHNLDLDGGVMVTASHNPPEYNGFKICYGKESIFGEEIQEIRRIIEKGDFVKGKGSITEEDMVSPYMEYIKDNLNIEKSMSIAIDAGNGVAGPVAYPLYKSLGLDVECLYCEPDGRFPNHQPDPTVADNLTELIRIVKERGLKLGIGFDGDADRIGVIDDKGNIIWGDELMIIFAREILKEHPGATIIGEVKCSKRMYDELNRLGARAIMWKTGHSLIKRKMKEENALLAGEMSGHIFFSDRYLGFDDAIYAGGRLLEILSKIDSPLSEMLADLPVTYSTPEIRVECPDEIKFQVVEELKKELEGKYPIIDVDGLRLNLEDGWGLVRASNTQPVLVLRFEAFNEDRLNEIREMLEEALDKVRKRIEG